MAGFRVAGEQRRAFEQDGVVMVRDVVDADWRGELEAAVERDIADPRLFIQRVPVRGRLLSRQPAGLGER
ncbi:MAG: hypothetical protein OXE86_07525 [Alphaproteobacteria bacterium]|nr:hypothetical protein [Alphaproteobacteria bacterium]